MAAAQKPNIGRSWPPLLSCRRADPGVIAFWAEVARDDTPLFLSVITIGELRRGVDLIRHRGDQNQAEALEQWLAQVLQDYGDRVLPLDGDAALLWGRLRVPDPRHMTPWPLICS